ncbi:MAG: tRNA lysidine(34) synthetase TilS [Melioribacteraceae bacterium]|nr:tRNA lysidine(34) synthetase TilS [Melioribacteraceae bacterium]
MKHQKTIEQDVFNFIKAHNLLTEYDRVLIGLSGGADSVFALHYLKKFSAKYKIEISALHVNHNLRGLESKRDENFCRSLCNKLGVKFLCSSVNVKDFAKKHKKSVEEAARDLRYIEFQKVAKANNLNLIVTSHNNDDNTETVLLNIVNGAGLNGISGIPIKRGNIVRPFLCLSKGSIISYLVSANIEYVEDSSNTNIEYRRNFLRERIIPELKENINPSIDKAILRSSIVYRNQIKIIEFFIESIFSNIVSISNGKVVVKISELEKYSDEIIGEILKKIFISHLQLDYNFNKFEKFRELIKSQVGVRVLLGKKISAVRDRNKIVFTQSDEIPINVNSVLNIGKTIEIGNIKVSINYVRKLPQKNRQPGKVEFINADNLSKNLIIRNWKVGDKIQLLGMKGTKKISDVLTDLKTPTLTRKNQLVLVNNKDIVWILGKRISEKYKVTEQSQKIVKLCLS